MEEDELTDVPKEDEVGEKVPESGAGQQPDQLQDVSAGGETAIRRFTKTNIIAAAAAAAVIGACIGGISVYATAKPIISSTKAQISNLQSQSDTMSSQISEQAKQLSTLKSEKSEIQEKLDRYTNVTSSEPDVYKACQILFDGDSNLIDLNTEFLEGFADDASTDDALTAFSSASLAVNKIQEAYAYATPDMKTDLASFNAPFLKAVYATIGYEYGDSSFDKIQMMQDLTDILGACVDVGYTVSE